MKHFYLKDWHWYLAFIAAIIFWLLVHVFFQPITPIDVLNSFELILVSIIIYPVLEEIVFRGLIQRQCLRFGIARRCFFGISGANVMTSILFTFLHFIHQPPLLAAMVFIPSLIFGYFRDRYKRIFPSILLHIFYNLGLIALFTQKSM